MLSLQCTFKLVVKLSQYITIDIAIVTILSLYSVRIGRRSLCGIYVMLECNMCNVFYSYNFLCMLPTWIQVFTKMK